MRYEQVDAYRDQCTHAGTPAYRCRVDGVLLKNLAGFPQRFWTLVEACDAGKRYIDAQQV